MAEGVGIEPTIPCGKPWLSKPAQYRSASLPWSEREGSNLRRPRLQRGALPLSYVPMKCWRRVQESNLHAGEGVGFRDRGDTNSATTLRKSR